MSAGRKHIDNFIIRYLSGEATYEERMQLEHWINESESNKKYFNDYRFVNDKAVSLHKIVNVDVDKAWINVKKLMKSSAKGRSINVIKAPYRISLWMKIAAVLLIVGGLSFVLHRIYLSFSGKPLQTYTIASKDSTLYHILTDSTLVILSKNTKITYNSYYGRAQRIVSLSGEAYFNVFHDHAKPFVVQVENVMVKDLGTSFIIRAFPDKSTIEVSVETGQVLFYTTNNPGIEIIYGETGVFDKESGTFRKYITLPGTVWGTNRLFKFRNDRLSDVIERLSAVYQAKIRLSNDSLSEYKITVTFDNEHIGLILDIIAETLGLRVIKTTDGYLLEKDSSPDR